MTEVQFITLVLRALGYDDSNTDFNWATANKKAIEIGLYDEDIVKHTDVLNKEFNRNGMSYISYNALFFKNIKTGEFLIDKLI